MAIANLAKSFILHCSPEISFTLLLNSSTVMKKRSCSKLILGAILATCLLGAEVNCNYCNYNYYHPILFRKQFLFHFQKKKKFEVRAAEFVQAYENQTLPFQFLAKANTAYVTTVKIKFNQRNIICFINCIGYLSFRTKIVIPISFRNVIDNCNFWFI